MTSQTVSEGSAGPGHRVVPHDEWLAARRDLLAKEKEFTRLRDALGRERRALPWEEVTKRYVFQGPDGDETLAQLFGPCGQLVVYHFMFAPEWVEGCPHCSFWADSFEGIGAHLRHRDTRLVAISRAPLARLEAFRKRMGWTFPWYSSGGTDFNFDYQVSFTPEARERGTAVYNYVQEDPGQPDREGVSAFIKDARGAVHHTYSCYARGIDLVNSAYNLLDLTAKGRDEDGLDFTQAWVRHHDRYDP
jgi:predicted dithiol-disulfide oxidoreductase (DUF899 family)